jgi:hypothetical protein
MPAADQRLVIICPHRTAIIARVLMRSDQTLVFA